MLAKIWLFLQFSAIIIYLQSAGHTGLMQTCSLLKLKFETTMMSCSCRRQPNRVLSFQTKTLKTNLQILTKFNCSGTYYESYKSRQKWFFVKKNKVSIHQKSTTNKHCAQLILDLCCYSQKQCLKLMRIIHRWLISSSFVSDTTKYNKASWTQRKKKQMLNCFGKTRFIRIQEQHRRFFGHRDSSI